MLAAPILEHWDRCRRMGVWLDMWQSVRVTPLGAVYKALAKVLEAPDYHGPSLARDHVMTLAAQRGVETDRQDPYDMMVHYAAMAEVLARAIRQPATEPLAKHPVVGSWQPEAYLVDGGMRLMRVVLVDHWDDDRRTAELHSWQTMGDVCVTGLPMTIRVLVIGQSRNGKRHGHWTRARQHPHSKRLRFQRKHAKDDGFTGSWGTVWRENTQVGPDPWIEQMARDEVLREVAFEQRVTVPAEWARQRVLEDIERIGDELEQTVVLPPMTRSACDSPIHGPCRMQCCCYAPGEVTPGETGMFVRRTR
jgi:hypothetical protein